MFFSTGKPPAPLVFFALQALERDNDIHVRIFGSPS